MNKKAIVILADGFEEIEAITVIDILRRAGIEVTPCGLESKTVKGSKGIVVEADKMLEDDDIEYDACILPGGMPGSENLAKSEKVKKILLDMDNQGKIIGAICAAPAIVLAPLGVLDDKSATCYPGMEEAFADSTDFRADDIVVDGNIITSRGPATALKFALGLVDALCGKPLAEKIANSVLLR